ncbi:MAG: helix-turn-helix domain-containing protein [Lachnospiraceae bacterium]
MKKVNTASRLRTLIDDRGLRQVDILKACAPYCQEYHVKMNKSDISQYLSGKTEPNQSKLFILASALNVNETWLMGFDVPIERPAKITSLPTANMLTENTAKLLHLYHDLNTRGRAKLIDAAEEMTFNPLYNDNYQKVIAAHERTDIAVTKDMIQHDNDIMNDDSEWE